jgi:hypothetical protein
LKKKFTVLFLGRAGAWHFGLVFEIFWAPSGYSLQSFFTAIKNIPKARWASSS